MWKQNIDGQLLQYTKADCLHNNWINNITEVNGTSGPETWAAVYYGGISVFRGG